LEGIVLTIPTFQEADANFAGIEIKGVDLIVWHVAKGSTRFPEVVEACWQAPVTGLWCIGGERDQSGECEHR
jgi:hypothetical protein